MKFKKEDRILILMAIFINIVLIVSVILLNIILYPALDEFPQYKYIIRTVMIIGYGIAGCLTIFLDGFLLYIRFCLDDKGNPIGGD